MLSDREQVVRKLDFLNEANFRQVSNFVAFLEQQQRMDQNQAELKGTEEQLVPAEDASLEEMLAQITPENLHGEADWGAPVGKEVW